MARRRADQLLEIREPFAAEALMWPMFQQNAARSASAGEEPAQDHERFHSDPRI